MRVKGFVAAAGEGGKYIAGYQARAVRHASNAREVGDTNPIS